MKYKSKLKKELKELKEEIELLKHKVDRPFKYDIGFENDDRLIVDRNIEYNHYYSYYYNSYKIYDKNIKFTHTNTEEWVMEKMEKKQNNEKCRQSK